MIFIRDMFFKLCLEEVNGHIQYYNETYLKIGKVTLL